MIVVEGTDYGWHRRFEWGPRPRCRWEVIEVGGRKPGTFEVLATALGVTVGGKHTAIHDPEAFARLIQLAGRVASELKAGTHPKDVRFV